MSDEIPDEAAEELEAREPIAKRFGRLLSGIATWLALVLSVVALAIVGYGAARDRLAADETAASLGQVDELRASIGMTQSTLAELQQSVAEAADRESATRAAIQQLDQQLDSRLSRIESVPGRLSALELSMASLQGISAGARDAWLLAEAEYYMQIANAQLQLAGNPGLARQALAHADERIVQLADPRLTGVRQALSDELRSLEALQQPDIAGMSLTLASLAGVVESLPLRQGVEAIGDDEAATDEELTGTARAWASVKNAVTGVVSIRDIDEVERPLVSPEARYFLRANLSLQLQTARLAVLRGESEVFQQSLDDVDRWIEQYYDTDASSVVGARQTIAELRERVLAVDSPDISRSLRLLRQYTAAPGTSTEPEADPVAPETAAEQ